MFDKAEYWKRRKEGKSGQEDLPAPKLLKTSNIMLSFTDGKPMAKNRAKRRAKAVGRKSSLK